MIKALLLIFFPFPIWERISTAQRKWGILLLTYLVPFLVIIAWAEGYGLVKWGKPRGAIPHLVQFSLPQAVVFETAQFLLMMLIVFLLAWMIKALGETFHGRHTFRQAFTVISYGLGPMLWLKLLDTFPGISPWLIWAIGIVLSAAVLYSGLPIIMQPDPPHTLGLYLMSSMMLFGVTGVARFITAWYLEGKFPRLDDLVSKLAAMLPFH